MEESAHWIVTNPSGSGTVTLIPFPDESLHTVSHHTEICPRTRSNRWQSLGLSLALVCGDITVGFRMSESSALPRML